MGGGRWGFLQRAMSERQVKSSPLWKAREQRRDTEDPEDFQGCRDLGLVVLFCFVFSPFFLPSAG